MSHDRVLFWFRQDLRLWDNPALHAAGRRGDVLPVYILDDQNAGPHKMGAASRWWLHHALHGLNESLDGKLSVYSGDAKKILLALVQRHRCRAVFWTRCYEPWRMKRDAKIEASLQGLQVEVSTFKGSLLWEPWEVLKKDGTPYKVFTPFYRNGCLNAATPRHPLPKPRRLALIGDPSQRDTIDDLGLLPKVRWDKPLEPHWQVSERGAQRRLKAFIRSGLQNYREGRNCLAAENVSRLSPYLHFGQLSPNQAWEAARASRHFTEADHFCMELGWREFSYSLLHQFPDLAHKNWRSKFDAFPWQSDDEALERWQRGTTGYPIVDAGMRELWQTGYMHNRVRMIVGSFLVKNLLLDWRLGERWFWDCLVDADLANNSASWQWIAGCGADAAPYFRIFNPVTQGQKFDPSGVYTRRFLPELTKLPNRFLFSPWEAPNDVLRNAGVTLGETYPKPIVDLPFSRERALQALGSI